MQYATPRPCPGRKVRRPGSVPAHASWPSPVRGSRVGRVAPSMPRATRSALGGDGRLPPGFRTTRACGPPWVPLARREPTSPAVVPSRPPWRGPRRQARVPAPRRATPTAVQVAPATWARRSPLRSRELRHRSRWNFSRSLAGAGVQYRPGRCSITCDGRMAERVPPAAVCYTVAGSTAERASPHLTVTEGVLLGLADGLQRRLNLLVTVDRAAARSAVEGSLPSPGGLVNRILPAVGVRWVDRVVARVGKVSAQ